MGTHAHWGATVLPFKILNKYSGRSGLSDHSLPIFIFKKLLSSPLSCFEVRSDVIFSQSGDNCPGIHHPNCIYSMAFKSF